MLQIIHKHATAAGLGVLGLSVLAEVSRISMVPGVLPAFLSPCQGASASFGVGSIV